MYRRTLLAVLLAAAGAPAAELPGADDWKYDVVERTAGEPLRGLVAEQTARAVKIHCVWRRPGKPTLVFTDIVPRNEIRRLTLLGDTDREALRGRLEALKRQRAALADGLRAVEAPGKGAAGDRLDFRRVSWPGGGEALEYRSTYFRLVAQTRPALAQLAATHLEQVYAAYSRLLPPRRKAEPTTVLLTGSLAGYQALVRGRGLVLFNPAFYDPARNQVVCGSDLERLCDERDRVRAHHADLRAKMKRRRTELAKAYRGKVPAELLAALADAERRVAATERRNEATFAGLREKLFQRLYHEAFHAYLGTFVYPAASGPLPVWFNEGLAQVFETAVVEVDELRVRPVDPDRLRAVRLALEKGEHPSLADLLRSTPRQFQVAHARDGQASDRTYRAAWAAAAYLTFEKRLLGTAALDAYVAALHRGADPLDAFRDLVGRPVAAFEKEFHDHLRRLRPDGTPGP